VRGRVRVRVRVRDAPSVPPTKRSAAGRKS
jgi:hypothetical protein